MAELKWISVWCRSLHTPVKNSAGFDASNENRALEANLGEIYFNDFMKEAIDLDDLFGVDSGVAKSSAGFWLILVFSCLNTFMQIKIFQ